MGRVRARDGKFVVTGIEIDDDDFDGFEAAHIFPMAHLDLWISGRWANLITDDHGSIGETKINSVQNGILLTANAHILFDKYKIAINPDDDYKITCFARDKFGFDGRHADLRNESPRNHQVLNSPPKNHFRMAVLCNMKGRGPEFDWDEGISPGMDAVRTISESPMGKLRFETVIANRLNALVA